VQTLPYIPSRSKTRIRDRGWILIGDLPRSPKADAVCADILDRLQQHEAEDTLPRGANGLFYDLRPHGIPGNPRGVTYIKKKKGELYGPMEAGGDYVQDLLSKMRRVWNPKTEKWLVDEKWISDSRAPDPITPHEAKNAIDAAKVVAAYIRTVHLTRQAGQPLYLEIRCEAADLMPRIARIALDYGVPVFAGGGMDGLKPKKDAAERAARRAVPTRIAHLTDWNKYGRAIAVAFEEDAKEFLGWHRDYENAPGCLSIERIGLTLTQAQENDLLDAAGDAELDGLPVPVLDALVQGWIEANSDPDIRQAVIAAEPKMHADVARHLQRIMKN
jgi:hypothetical protein